MDPLTITSIQSVKEKNQLIAFMRTQGQFYPNYEEWLFGKCQSRIESGQYKPIVAISNGLVVANAVYQYLDEHNIEIKNFRIDKQYQNRFLGRFLLQQVAHVTKNKTMNLDVSVDNFSGVEFFIHNGFKIEQKENLYDPNRPEYIMKKSFN